MLLSHRKQFIFLKTGKTAGTSIEAYFEPWCLGPSELESYQFEHSRPAHIGPAGAIGARHKKYHDTADGLISHMRAPAVRDFVGEVIWDRYFKFATVRNPYEKPVSMFYMRAPAELGLDLDALSHDEARTHFKRWLKERCAVPNDHEFLCSDGGKGAVEMDDLIRYESLEADLERVCHALDIPYDPERLPRLKAGNRDGAPDWRFYYDAEALELANTLYAWEFEHLGYEQVDPAAFSNA